jgi:hypothetical protein
MDPIIQKELASTEASEFHKQMLEDSKALVDMSRKTMSKYYGQWDHNDEIYRGYRTADVADRKAAERGEPTKMVVPLTYAQTQTFVAFCFALYTQRETIFELKGKTLDSHKPAKLSELLVQRDLCHNTFESKLYQMLVDLARFGVAPLKISWTKETQRVREYSMSQPTKFLGMTLPGTGGQEVMTETEVTKYLGNKIMNISPYRFYPDVRLPLGRFQDGEFCASEDEYTMTELYQLQADGHVAGVEQIGRMSNKMIEARGGHRMSTGFHVADELGVAGNGQTQSTVIVTELVRKIIPSQYKINGKPLGKSNRPEKWLIWYANDTKVIRCEPLGYMHDEFPYALGEFSPDIHSLIGMSLADTIDSLQAIVTWFINSRITSVRKVIQNYLIVDPEGVELKDLQERKPVIRLKPGAAARGGIDRWIKQLKVDDVTTNHLADAKFLHELVQITSGINENMLGQFHQGRRSATEARNVGSSAATRLKMIATLVFRTCLEPMARQMVSNLRDGLDEATLVSAVGLDEAMETPYLSVSRRDLVGQYDFEVFDGTLPSERTATADIFAQILEMFMKAPEGAIALGIDPKACFIELMELRRIRNPKRFMLPGTPPVQPQPQPNVPPAVGAPAGAEFPAF